MGPVRLAGLPIKTLICVGGLLSCAGYLSVNRATKGQVSDDFELSSEARVHAVQREVEDNFGVLQVLRAYFETARDDGPNTFDHFAGQTIAAYRSLRALEWAPRVRAPDRAAFEARMSGQVPGFSGIVTGVPKGKLVRAPDNPDYYPIQNVSPWNRSASFVGYDMLSSSATSTAVLRAITTGEPSSTARLPLWEQHSDGFGVITVLPVYDAPDKGRGAEWRQQHCRGVVLCVVETSALVAAALQHFGQQGIRTYVFDLSATGPRRTLYPVGASKISLLDPAVRTPEELHREKLVYSQKLPVGGREWEILCVGSSLTALGVSWQSQAFMLFGVIVIGGVAVYLVMISKYTSDLASSNHVLRSQMEDRQKAQAELDYQAHHDPLTGLPNRREFGRRFNEAIERAKLSNENLALFFVDLDGFKMINDTLGHAVGDGVLKAVGERFRKSIGRNDIVARTGGDEFNILLTGAGTGTLADRVAQGLLDSLSEPVEIAGRCMSLSASIGISLFPEHGQDFQELAHCSDAAMYFAKKRGKNRFHRYTKELAVTTRRGLELAMSLRGAIERNELCLFFQPIIGIGTEPTLRLEALVRWRHPQIGLLGPSHFFSLAEENGLAATIGNWVLKEACRLAGMWQSIGRPVGVSVNVSGMQFSRPDFVESVDAALTESGLRPSLLEIEVSESSLVGEIEESLVRLGMLRRKGVTVAIDDFGTGYSALTYLETLPIDALKIDRSFLPRSESNFRRSSLLRSLIALGRSLNLRVVVSGIEVARQLELVRGMNPSEVQGFLLSKPLASASVLEFIERWNSTQATPDIERILETTRPAPDLVLVRPQRSQAV
jgi:diguanylate cyclase (GGDEF)-like protein